MERLLKGIVWLSCFAWPLQASAFGPGGTPLEDLGFSMLMGSMLLLVGGGLHLLKKGREFFDARDGIYHEPPADYPFIETDQYRLQALRLEDIEALSALCSYPLCTVNFPHANRLQDPMTLSHFIQDSYMAFHLGDGFSLAIHDQKEESLVGILSVWEHPEGQEQEWGLMVREEHARLQESLPALLLLIDPKLVDPDPGP